MTAPPDGLRYSRDHLWVRLEDDGTARVGLTDFAQETLGDIVDVTVPNLHEHLTAGQVCGDVESTKSVNDLVSPLRGTVTATNPDLDARPELVNTDPYVAGWLFALRPEADSGAGDLLSAAQYAQLTGR